LPWPQENFTAFFPADDYAVRGLSVRNRTDGIGLPLVAMHERTPEMPESASPITAFLRVSGNVSDLGKGSAATLEFYSAYDEIDLVVKGRHVPLETDSTTPLAYRLDEEDLWKMGFRKFFSPQKQDTELFLNQPYQPGRIPVVFIHGTASSPVWWAEMWNTLRSDPVLRNRFQFWFFMYNSSVIVAQSATELRESLFEMAAKLDPGGEDPSLQQMVLIGHSQGGLLTKLCVVKTGDTLWRAMSDRDIEDLDTEPEIKDLLRQYFFLEPLPFVTRVVYISTPHRGSFRAKSWVRNLLRGFINLPYNVLTGDPKIYGNLFGQMKIPRELQGKALTSVDSMSPDNPALNALADMPAATGVKAHSIIAVKGDGDPETGNDGVVEYTSAHQEGVESEYIVRDSHSCQGNPLTIEEVRRILLFHLAALDDCD
jgi:triacylglycerol esterase/lipase EstA (alpha/beta hydrolase family)